jgi:hypothetical protein
MFISNHEYIWILLVAFTVVVLFIVLSVKSRRREKEKITIDLAIESAGYSYDERQDIFYSQMDAWQRKYGYCQLYDEAAAPLSMIIDCEPIRFEYGGKRWLIEFWKGQYGMTTGCEIGVYTTSGPDLDIPGVFNGTVYNSASEEDHLFLAFLLRKGSTVLFRREGKHWWLTGFKLGKFSEPEELTLEVAVTLKDQMMRDAFLSALQETGYTNREVRVLHNTVWVSFSKPYSPQPLTRIEATDRLTQRKNQLMCQAYENITKGYSLAPQKIAILRKKAPDLFEWIIRMGKPIQLFRGFEKIWNR